MRKKRSFFRTMAFVLMVILGSWGIGYTAVENSSTNVVAEEMVGSSGISWAPVVNYEKIILTVSRPDGSVFRKTFEAGTNPYLDLSNIHGDYSCDGTYTYELRVIPRQLNRTRGEDRKSLPQELEALTQSGHFQVKGGALVSKQLSETPSRAMDVVHADDTIITGSVCIGYDCLTDGTESFGFDTLKMKENNIQIYFDDTSTTAGFPANDWRIIANDSSSGGGSYLSIADSTNSHVPFKVMAGARTNSLFVSNTGRVGIGTGTPVLDVHMTRGDSPAIRFEQDATSGWTAQTFDIAGNESNFFIRDVTAGSKLPFRIQPGTPTNTLTLRADGNVGIGTWSPDFPLEIERTGENASVVVTRTDGASNYMNATTTHANFGSTTNHPLRLMTNSSWRMMLNVDGSLTMSNGASLTAGGTWTNASSRTLKENINTLSTSEALVTLKQLNPVKYNYKVDKTDKHVGFIAEESPDLVTTPDKKGMSPMDVVAVLTRVVQEQQKTLQEQQQLISELQKKIAALEEKK